MKLETFFDKFDVIADAPNAVAKIRNLILDLAIHGRLLTQGDTDVPRIAISDRSTHVSDDELNPLPIDWEWRQLGEMAEFINGDRSKNYPSKSYRVEEGVPFINAGHLANGNVDLSKMDYITQEHFDRLGGGKIQLGDVLYCLRGSLGKCAVVQSISRGAIASSLLIIRPSKQLISRYVYLYLSSPLGTRQISKYDNGSAQPNLSATNVKKYQIPLPPIAKQKQIVAKVDELMALCDQLEAQRIERETWHAKLDRASLDRFSATPTLSNLSFMSHKSYNISPSVLRKIILTLGVQGCLVPQDSKDEPVERLADFIEKQRAKLLGSKSLKIVKHNLQLSFEETTHFIPKTWIWTRLGDITDIGTGSTPSRTEPSFWVGGAIPWVTSGSTSHSPITEADEYVTPEAVKTHRLRIYPPGTLLVALYGQGKTRGQVAKLEIQATINQACAAICPLNGLVPMQDYLKILLEKQYDEMRLLASGGAQPNLNLQKIKEVLVPLPPLAEQRRIVAKVNQLMALVDQLEMQINMSNSTGESLMGAITSSLTGTRIERTEPMRAPKTELISVLRIGTSPYPDHQGPLARLISAHRGEIPAKLLWQSSGMSINDFYQQLRSEIAQGWIALPESAIVQEVKER